MSVYEVIFSAANSCISHQLRYVNAVRRIPWYVTIMCNVLINFKPGRDVEGGRGGGEGLRPVGKEQGFDLELKKIVRCP